MKCIFLGVGRINPYIGSEFLGKGAGEKHSMTLRTNLLERQISQVQIKIHNEKHPNLLFEKEVQKRDDNHS